MAEQAVITQSAAGTRVASMRHTARLYTFAVEHLLALPLGAALALLWVNLEPESYYRATYAMAFVVNEIGMAFFFALLSKEVVEATLPGGVLRSWRRVALPLVAAIGAVAVPAALFVVFVTRVDEPMLRIGWPVASAIDLALAYFVARLIFGNHPAIPFLVALGIGATALAFGCVAVLYPVREPYPVEGAALLALALAVAWQLRRLRVRSFWPYILAGGGIAWLACYRAGLHPALALVPIVPFLPHVRRDPGFFVDARPGARDTLSRFELWWTHPVQIVLFLFALVNAGVRLSGLESGVWGVPVASLAGTPLGIMAASGLGRLAGLHLPPRVGWRELLVISCAASTGFTMALFFTSAIMAPGQLLSETRMGVLLGLAAVPLALGAARLLRVGRWH